MNGDTGYQGDVLSIPNMERERNNRWLVPQEVQNTAGQAALIFWFGSNLVVLYWLSQALGVALTSTAPGREALGWEEWSHLHSPRQRPLGLKLISESLWASFSSLFQHCTPTVKQHCQSALWNPRSAAPLTYLPPAGFRLSPSRMRNWLTGWHTALACVCTKICYHRDWESSKFHVLVLLSWLTSFLPGPFCILV